MIFYLIFFTSIAAQAGESISSLSELCFNELRSLPGKSKESELKQSCQNAKRLDPCESEKGTAIFHIDVPARSSEKHPRKILVFSLIHGDELPAGSLARSWMERLTKVEPRNQWRLIPILNPDGLKARTRTNANGIDINRNFPTSDWEKEASKYWKKTLKKDIVHRTSVVIHG